MRPYYKSKQGNFILLHGDTFELLRDLNFKFDMIFADPPYFLSNDGLTVKNGKVTSVNKGNWDKSYGLEYVYEFNRRWLELVRTVMAENATLWISGTMHNIFTIGHLLKELGFKILNTIIWQKTNPPPNFSKRYFTYSTEIIIWARKSERAKHYFDYDLMKKINNGKQMKDVWTLPAVAKWEKNCGKHPTQKPLPLLARIIVASTKAGDWVLDPFTGSSTTGIAANLLNRKFVGIDIERQFLDLSIRRRQEIEDKITFEEYKRKLKVL